MAESRIAIKSSDIKCHNDVLVQKPGTNRVMMDFSVARVALARVTSHKEVVISSGRRPALVQTDEGRPGAHPLYGSSTPRSASIGANLAWLPADTGGLQWLL